MGQRKKATICLNCSNCVKEKYYRKGFFGGKGLGADEYLRCGGITDFTTGKPKINRCEVINTRGDCKYFKKGQPSHKETETFSDSF